MFYPTVTRSAADPHEISAGAGIGYFSLVWNIGQGQNRNIVGGPSTLTQGLATALGDRVRLEAEVVRRPRHPATVSHRVAVDLPRTSARRSARWSTGPT